MPNYCQNLIHQLEPTINPAGVEASMRLQFGTLDHLSKADFIAEIEIARVCQEQDPDYLHDVAQSFGLSADFDRWAEQLAPKDK